MRQRAKWHLQNPRVVPTVRGLRVARSTAVMPPAERATACAQAADDLGALTKFARHPEAYLYALWGWMVRGAAIRCARASSSRRIPSRSGSCAICISRISRGAVA